MGLSEVLFRLPWPRLSNGKEERSWGGRGRKRVGVDDKFKCLPNTDTGSLSALELALKTVVNSAHIVGYTTYLPYSYVYCDMMLPPSYISYT